MRMVGEGERVESTCLRKNRRILGGVRVSRGCERTYTLSWEMQPTLYAILVRRLDLCQDYLSRKGSEDGHPKDDYDIESESIKRKRIQRYGLGSRLTCIPEKTVPISDFTLSYLCHVEHADAEANIVEDAVCVFLVELVDESLFWGETELGGVYRNLVLSVPKKNWFRTQARIVREAKRIDLQYG